MWEVMVPLLDRIKDCHESASSANEVIPTNIMVHHSRNTAAKQWDETRSLVFSGFARVVTTLQPRVFTTESFLNLWNAIMQYCQVSAMDASQEVALAAVNTFQVRSASSREYERREHELII